MGLQGQNGLFKLSKKKSARIPVKVVNNLIIVETLVNEIFVLNFIVDTGVRIPILLDPDLTILFNDKQKRKITVRGLGPEDAQEAELIGNNTVQIGELRAENLNLVILPVSDFDISEYLGVHVHGIIGYDLFWNLMVEMDYANQWLRFYQHEGFKGGKRFTKLPIDIEKFKPYIQAQTVSQNDSIKVKLLIDTGASHPLTLYTESHEAIVVGTPRIEAYLGTGLSGDLRGYISRTEQLQFADFEFNRITTAFPDSMSVRHLEGEGRRNGSIGGGVMKRFRVIFDYHNRKLYLKKGRSFKEGFDYNKSGIIFKAKGEDLKVFEVEKVDTGSAGDKAQLRVGDELVRIQQHYAENLSLNEVYNIFNMTKEGKAVRLVIRRDGRLMKTKVILKSII